MLKNILKKIKKIFPKARFFWAIALFLVGKSALHRLGWFKSAWRMEAVDSHNQPIPWLTYSAIYFLGSRLNKKFRVFEYGSGNSTKWWAKRVSKIVSVEYDRVWLEKIRPALPKNAEIIYQELNSEYPKTILKQKGVFDIVVVDGRERVESALNSITKLSSKGVIIWDNTDRERYQAGIRQLLKLGFKKLDFFGAVAIDNQLALTSIFYRESNILDI